MTSDSVVVVLAIRIDSLTTLPVLFFLTCLHASGQDHKKAAPTNDSIIEKVSQDESAAHYVEKVESFFERHCHDCHDDETQKGRLNLLAVTPDMDEHSQVLRWTDIVDRIESGEMPSRSCMVFSYSIRFSRRCTTSRNARSALLS